MTFSTQEILTLLASFTLYVLPILLLLDYVLKTFRPSPISPQSQPASPAPINLEGITIYKLHKRSVVKLAALPFAPSPAIQRYQLRGEPVIRLEALEAHYGLTT